jgi:iron complex outermembrane recepter protein
MHRSHLLRGASAVALALFPVLCAHAQEALPTIDIGSAPPPQGPVAGSAPPPAPQRADRLGHTEKPFSGSYVPESVAHVADISSATREEIEKTVNVMTTAETFKYLPSVLVRERFIGDRNATVEGRVNNPQDSARTMVFADGVLLSNYLGNSYAYPPRWGMVSPAEIERIDVIAGPFSALYPGNSVSGVYTITTRMPENFEAHFSGNGAVQPFGWFQEKSTNLSGDMNIAVGDRINDFSYWVTYDRLDAQGQAQTFSMNTFNPSPGKNGWINAFGGQFAADQNGNLNLIGGAAGADHSEQHMGKVKLAYDLAPATRLTYQIGFWSLVDNTFVNPFMTTPNGIPLYNLGKSTLINLGPYGFYGLSGLNPSHSNASHLMQAAELKSDTRGLFDYDLVATQYNFLRDYSNTASAYGFTPTVSSKGLAWSINPTGSNVNQGGNFWRTFDARFIYRPDLDLFGRHIVSFGGHADVYSLNTVQTNTDVWMSNYYYDIQAVNYGKTQTNGLYIQDEWKFSPQWRLTTGARGDFWTAFGGVNNALGKAPLYSPESSKGGFEPKTALEYQVTPEFLLRGAIGRNYRFPTVAELFQAVNGPNSILVNNPNLQPESSTVYDLTGEYHWANAFDGKVGLMVPRISLFEDDRWNFIASQTAYYTGIPVTQQYNIDKVRFRGVEGAVDMKDVYWPGFDFNASATFTDSKTLSDYVQPWYDGMQVPRVPRIRIRAVGSYSPDDKWTFAGGVRYASGSFTTLANTDFNHNTYGLTDSEYLVFDAKVTYKFAPHWTATAGIDNIGRWKYVVNPNPYPERTYFLGVKYDIGGPGTAGGETMLAGVGAPGAGSGLHAR